jgi:hypothetical protein
MVKQQSAPDEGFAVVIHCRTSKESDLSDGRTVPKK